MNLIYRPFPLSLNDKKKNLEVRPQCHECRFYYVIRTFEGRYFEMVQVFQKYLNNP